MVTPEPNPLGPSLPNAVLTFPPCAMCKALGVTGGKQTTPQHFARVPPAWSKRRHSKYGYGLVRVTQAMFDFRFVEAATGGVLDRFTAHANGSFEDHWRGPVTG
jgi:hypothetical protein